LLFQLWLYRIFSDWKNVNISLNKRNSVSSGSRRFEKQIPFYLHFWKQPDAYLSPAFCLKYLLLFPFLFLAPCPMHVAFSLMLWRNKQCTRQKALPNNYILFLRF
jgi:hypothetical protein